MRVHRVVQVLAAALLVGLLVSACAGGGGPATPTPAAQRTVKVGLGISLTGALASTTVPISYGIWDYLRYVNDVQGGLKYRSPGGQEETVTLELKWEDMAYDPARSVATYKRLKDWGAQMMHLTAGSMLLPNLGSITKDNMAIPYYGPSQPNAMAERPINTVGQFGTYTDEDALFASWVKDNWKEARPPKIGYLHLETAMSRAELPGKLPDYVRGIGVDYLGMEWLPYAVTDSSVELKRLADAGADWIFTAHVPGGASTIYKDAQRLGLLGKIKFFMVHWGFSEGFLEAAGPLSEGVYGWIPSATAAENLPGVKLAGEIAQRYHPGYKLNSNYIQGNVVGMVMVEALKKALEKTGYANLTREAIRDAMVSIRGLDTGGIVPTINMDPAYPLMNPKYKVGVVQGGQFRLVSDWLEMKYLMKGWKPQ